MRLSASTSLARWARRAAVLGLLAGGMAFARHRTIARHEIDLRAGPAAAALDGDDVGAEIEADPGEDDSA